MGGAKWAYRDDWFSVEQAHDAVDLGGLEGLREGQVRQNRGKPLCEHRLARTGGSHQDHIMSSGCSDLQGALHMLLSFDFVEVGLIEAVLSEKILQIDMCPVQS